jgi:hypothetical protein
VPLWHGGTHVVRAQFTAFVEDVWAQGDTSERHGDGYDA